MSQSHDEPIDHGHAGSGGHVGAPTVAHQARVYDYWLGGKDNFAIDREVGEQVKQLAPWAQPGARACRAFLGTAVDHLARLGVTQFLDIGSGLPTAGNVHEIARSGSPDVRVVYVDYDPVVIAHAHALLSRDPGVDVLRADLRQPQEILRAVRGSGWLDLDRPVALLLSAILHFVPDDDQPLTLIATLREALAPGSYLMISHTFADDDDRGTATRLAAARYNAAANSAFTPRTTAEIEALFHGWEPVPPGLQQLSYDGQDVTVLGGIARLV